MIPLTTMRELFDHNYWARDRQLEVCATLNEEQFLRPMGSSFSSLRDTLAHLVVVEWLWLERWRGRSPRTLMAAEEFPTLTALADRWRAVEAEMREYLAGLSEEALARSETYVNTRGQTWTYDLWQMIFHLLNHQTYHRGQVTTLLRQLGAQPAGVEYLMALDAGLGSSPRLPMQR